MALVNGSDYDHIDLHSVAGGDVTRHMLKDAEARTNVADLSNAFDLLYKKIVVEKGTTSSKTIFIPLKNGAKYKIKNNTSGGLGLASKATIDSSTNVESFGTLAANSEKTIQPTQDADYLYLYFTASGNATIECLDRLIPMLNEAVEELGTEVDSLGDSIDEIMEELSDYDEVVAKTDGIITLTQYLKEENITTEKYYNRNGTISSTPSAGIYAPFPVKAGVTYHYKNLYNYFCYVKDAENNMVFFSDTPNDASEGSITPLTDGTAYITTRLVSGVIVLGYFTDGELPDEYVEGTYKYKFITDGSSDPDETKTIEVYPSDDIIQKLVDNAGKNFHFNTGSYDIIAIYKNHFGNDYFDNYTDYSSGGNNLGRGLPVYRNTTYTFSQGAVFSANYTGENTAVRSNFAAFALESGVTIDGLRLSCSGIRNCLHDDFDNSVAGKTTIKNCCLSADTNVIAGGLGVHDVVVIENCYIERTSGTIQYDFSYHNNGNAGAQSLIVVKDNYLARGVSIRWYGQSTLLTDVYISNNSMAYNVDVHAENASATIENVSVKEWNNFIRP